MRGVEFTLNFTQTRVHFILLNYFFGDPWRRNTQYRLLSVVSKDSNEQGFWNWLHPLPEVTSRPPWVPNERPRTWRRVQWIDSKKKKSLLWRKSYTCGSLGKIRHGVYEYNFSRYFCFLISILLHKSSCPLKFRLFLSSHHVEFTSGPTSVSSNFFV